MAPWAITLPEASYIPKAFVWPPKLMLACLQKSAPDSVSG
jgi:hypothetical protein